MERSVQCLEEKTTTILDLFLIDHLHLSWTAIAIAIYVLR